MATITALNGRLPAAQLVVADTGPNGPQQLRVDAAASWARMRAAGLPAGHLRSGYRTLAQQQLEVAAAAAGQTPSALPAGKSQHGEGLAADEDEPGRTWLHQHGAPYGWLVDLIPNEPWHVQYDPTRDQETDVTLTPDQATQLANVNAAVGRLEKAWGSGARNDGSGRDYIVDLTGDRVAATLALVQQLAAGGPVNEQHIITGILAGLSPDKIAAAIPPAVAAQVVDALAAQLAKK